MGNFVLPRNLGSTIFVAQLPLLGYLEKLLYPVIMTLLYPVIVTLLCPVIIASPTTVRGRWVPGHRSQQGEAAARSGTCCRAAPAGCKYMPAGCWYASRWIGPPPHWPPNFRHFQVFQVFQVCLVDSAERKVTIFVTI